jgi:acyl carrier protein
MNVDRQQVADKLRAMIVERLNLDIKPEEIGGDEPLFASTTDGGLGLDSVEALEIVVGIEDVFGIRLGDEEGVEQRFYSINTLTDYVSEKLAEQPADAV